MSPALSCPACAARLAADQRYCVTCGERVRARPARVQATLDQMAGRARAAPVLVPEAEPSVRRLLGLDIELPSPRALATSVLAVLGFGVLLGSGNLSYASGPVDILLHGVFGNQSAQTAPPNQTAAVPVSPPASSGGTGSASSGSSSSSSSSPASSASTPSTSTSTSSSSSSTLPPIKHVWVVLLGDQGYQQTFAPGSPDKYLSAVLAQKGEVVPYYYGTSQGDLANEDAMISGQGPNTQTTDNCPSYSALAPGKLSSDSGQLTGTGCVFPKTTPTVLSELTAAHDTWKGYVQGMPASCTHPKLGASDGSFTATAKSAYTTWRNPFVYFAAVTGTASSCAAEDVPLTQLSGDLKSASKTPNVSFVIPDACDDGSDTPCRTGAPAGTAQSDTFLKTVIPEIQASPAYKADGLILITFAQAPGSGPDADESACCSQTTDYPNLPATTTTSTSTTTTGTGTGTGTATGTGTTTGTGTDAATGTGAATSAAVTTTGTASTPDTSASATDTTPGTGMGTSTDTASGTGTGTSTATGTTTSATGTSTSPCTTTGTTTTGTDTTTTGTGTGTTGTGSGTSTTGTGTTGTGTGTTEADTGTGTGTDATTASTTTTGTGTGTSTTSCTSASSITVPPDGSLTGGGGDVGLLALSQYVTPGNPDVVDYFNHYALLASIEQLFGLKPTGYAAASSLQAFSSSFYTAYSG